MFMKESDFSAGMHECKQRVIKTDGQTYTDGLVSYPAALWQAPEFEYCEELDFGGVGNVKGIFYTSPVTHNGKKTKIAAYIGFPESAKTGKKVPAIVLVHGGGGTAIPDWVKYWNDLGFAAISMDTEGAEPIRGVCNDSNVHIPENRYKNDRTYTNGPTNRGFSDGQLELGEQWMYHATSAVILACSLIASFDVVDPQKIGITGISWGGVITNIVIGYDDRFTFAIPVYGALSLTASCAKFKTAFQNANISARRWDTLEPLKQTNCKVFEINGVKDEFFSFDASSRSAAAANGFVLFKTDFPHTQAHGAYEENVPVFAKWICSMGHEFIEILENPTSKNPVIRYRTHGDVRVNDVILFYTAANHPDVNADWEKCLVPRSEGETTHRLTVPSKAKFYYVLIVYNTHLQVSSQLVERQKA